jgi:hypothetical protein
MEIKCDNVQSAKILLQDFIHKKELSNILRTLQILAKLRTTQDEINVLFL